MDPILILISANAEWQAVCRLLKPRSVNQSPYGDWFTDDKNVIFFQGGWGKIAAAGSAQYAIDRWHPKALINLGTCGGLAGEIEPNEIILAEKTVVYDIYERMGDADEHLAHYATEIDISWIGDTTPIPVKRIILATADRDLAPDEIQMLRDQYGAVAGDWESGAIAWVAGRNQIPVLILRGVTDVVGVNGSEAYGNLEYFREATLTIMWRLIDSLPDWLKLLKVNP